MATIVEKTDKNGNLISYKVIVRYKGNFVTKTFAIKDNKKKTIKNTAMAWGLDIEKQINEGTYRKEERKHNYTVSEAIDKYIKDVNPDCIKELQWFKKELGHLPIRNLQRSDLKRCRNKLQNKKKEIPIKGHKKVILKDELISNSTVNKYLASFSIFLSYCVNEYEILEANPMIGAKLKLKENEPRKRWLKELKERQTLLQDCEKELYLLYLCVLFVLTTGARKSEILNQTWTTSDLENKAIYFLNTKNGDDRTVPMPEILYEELKHYKEQNKIRYLKNDYIFKNALGKPYEVLVGKIFPKVVKKWQYENITFHGLRHTYISIASLLGNNQTIIKKIVGHKMDSVTGGYTHADCETLRKPMNEIANYMIYGTVEQQQSKQNNIS